MNAILGLLITWLVTTISLLIISKLPFVGVEIDGVGKAFWSAFVIGLLNGLFWILIAPLKWGGWITALPLFILNVIIFGAAAALVQGFRLNNKILSAVMGAFLLTLINKLIKLYVINKIFPNLADTGSDVLVAANTLLGHLV